MPELSVGIRESLGQAWQRTLEKAPEHEISWPLPEGMDAKALEQLFFGALQTPKTIFSIPPSLTRRDIVTVHRFDGRLDSLMWQLLVWPRVDVTKNYLAFATA